MKGLPNGVKNVATSWQRREQPNLIMDELGCRVAFKLEKTREEKGRERSSATDQARELVASDAGEFRIVSLKAKRGPRSTLSK